MDPALRQRILSFVKPLYQDLDGVSYYGDVERLSAIARQLYSPDGPDQDHFELLLAFQGLRNWLRKPGNLSRAKLTIGGLRDVDLAGVAESLKHLENPRTPAEQALAAALMIDGVGLVGLVDRFTHARREGVAVREVAAETIESGYELPDWLPARARAWVERRIERRRRFCEMVLEELARGDLL